MRILGLDQGTTSTRGLVWDADAGVEIVQAIRSTQSFPAPGWVEQDPLVLLNSLRACIAAAGAVDAIGIDNQGESCLAWDAETREPLSPVLSWQDKRTMAVLDRMRSDGAEAESLARAGLPLDPYFSAAKLGWIVRYVPAAAEALRAGRLRLGTTDAFFLDSLTGRFVTDVTTASRTSLMNLGSLQWDPQLCALFGVPMDCLPEIVPTTGDFGTVKSGPRKIPVTASVVDQQAALFGVGCHRRGQVKVTFGTGAFALMNTGSEIVNRPDLGLLPTVAWQLTGAPAVYAADGGVFTASAAVDWAKSLGLFIDYDDINQFETASAASRGVFFVPALAGLGCPHWNPRARGLWSGMGLEHGPSDLVQSLLEGIAYRADEVVAALNAVVPRSGAVRIDGGMTNNAYFTGFLAGLIDVEQSSFSDFTGIGCIRLSALGLGHDVQLEDCFSFASVTSRGDGAAYRARFRALVETAQSLAPGALT